MADADAKTGFDIVLQTEDGEQVRIGGSTYDSTFIVKGAPMFGDWSVNPPVKLPFHQGGARYGWGGEVTYGMIERSLPAEKVSF